MVSSCCNVWALLYLGEATLLLVGVLTDTVSPQEHSRKEQVPCPCSFLAPSNVTLGKPNGIVGTAEMQLEVS